MTPTLAHCVWPLPPEGAAAPTAWQSQFRGPGMNEITARWISELLLFGECN